MRLRLFSRPVTVLLWVFCACAQLPPDQKLSPEDNAQFRKELERLEKLLVTANDKDAIELQIANTYAAGGQFSEAMKRLRKVVAANVGFDPSRDPDFAKIQNTGEFRSVMDEVRRQTPPVHNSRLIATLREPNVRPESIAFDTRRKAFLLGNTAGSELARCSLAAGCVPFTRTDAEPNAYVLGLKIDPVADTVWATSSSNAGAGLRCYDLATGGIRRTAFIEGRHVFNDLAISSAGAVYVTDTAEGSVYELRPGTTRLRRIAPRYPFTAANGIAISADEKSLYVATWQDGIDVVDLSSGAVAAMVHPDHICLAFIDGLYAIQGSLIAIQNGPMLPRIVRFKLGANKPQIVGMTVLERRNPAFDGITTGVVVGSDFYYIANPQIDKKSRGDTRPFQVFGLHLAR